MVEQCQKCHDTGIVKEKDGTVHTCWDCLESGRIKVYSDNVPDSKIKI